MSIEKAKETLQDQIENETKVAQAYFQQHVRVAIRSLPQSTGGKINIAEILSEDGSDVDVVHVDDEQTTSSEVSESGETQELFENYLSEIDAEVAGMYRDSQASPRSVFFSPKHRVMVGRRSPPPAPFTKRNGTVIGSRLDFS